MDNASTGRDRGGVRCASASLSVIRTLLIGSGTGAIDGRSSLRRRRARRLESPPERKRTQRRQSGQIAAGRLEEQDETDRLTGDRAKEAPTAPREGTSKASATMLTTRETAT